MLARTDRARSWALLTELLHADHADTQHGTTREGVHLAAMAGAIDILLRCHTGLDARGDVLRFNPQLPDELPIPELHLHDRDQRVSVHVARRTLHLRAAPGAGLPDHRGPRRRPSRAGRRRGDPLAAPGNHEPTGRLARPTP